MERPTYMLLRMIADSILRVGSLHFILLRVCKKGSCGGKVYHLANLVHVWEASRLLGYE